MRTILIYIQCNYKQQNITKLFISVFQTGPMISRLMNCPECPCFSIGVVLINPPIPVNQ